jgi:hypothetical protein
MKRLVFLFSLIVLLSAPLEAKEIRWVARAHPGMLAGLTDADLTPSGLSPDEVVERVRAPEFEGQVADFVDVCVKKGVTQIIMDGFQPELRGIYFRSPELEKLGWVPLADALGVLQAEASKRGLGVGLNLSEAAVHARGLYGADFGLDQVKRLSADGLASLARGLRQRYQLAAVFERDFPADWIALFERLASDLGIQYLRGVSADDIVSLCGEEQKTTPIRAFPQSLTLVVSDQFPLITEEVSNAVTNGSLALTLASNQPPAIELTDSPSGWLFLEGGALFRAAQSAPDQMIWAVDRDSLERITPPFLARIRALADSREASLPMMDVVVLGNPAGRLDPARVAWLQLASNLEPIMLGFSAAGYRVALSDEARPQAQAYYVYLAGDSIEQWKRTEEALSKSADKPVFVQFGSAPAAELLEAVSRFLDLPPSQWTAGLPSPVGVYKGRQFTYKGVDLYRGRVPTGQLAFQAGSPHGLVSDLAGLPLIWANPKAPGRLFVNSNLIHRDVAYPLSNLITSGRALQAPAPCFISVGVKTVFWALADTDVEWVHPRTGKSVSLEMKRYGFYAE